MTVTVSTISLKTWYELMWQPVCLTCVNVSAYIWLSVFVHLSGFKRWQASFYHLELCKLYVLVNIGWPQARWKETGQKQKTKMKKEIEVAVKKNPIKQKLKKNNKKRWWIKKWKNKCAWYFVVGYFAQLEFWFLSNIIVLSVCCYLTPLELDLYQ